MIYRAAAAFALTAIIAGCGGAPPATTGPAAPTAPAPGVTQPAVTQAPGGGNLGTNEGIARALVPPGSTQQSTSTFGDSFQIVVFTNMTLDQLKTFYTQQIPTTGATETGRFEISGTLTIAFTNPDGGIVVVPADDAGQFGITISVGIGG